MQTDSSPALIVFGEALIDVFPHGPRIGGAPFNVARVASCFDCAPLMITRIGDDANGQLISADMQHFGMDQRGMQRDSVYPTGQVQVHMEQTQGVAHRFEIMAEQAYDHIDARIADAAIASHQHGTTAQQGVIYYGTLAQREATSRETLHGLLKNKSWINYLDLNLRDGQYTRKTIFSSLFHADVLKVNEDELQMLAQTFSLNVARINTDLADPDNVSILFDVLEQLQALFKLSAIIVTLGAHGYVYLNERGEKLNGYDANPAPVSMIDTVGCGDAFSALCVTGMLKGWPVPVSLQRAHAFAASICSISGAVHSDLSFYRAWQNQWSTSGNQITVNDERA